MLNFSASPVLKFLADDITVATLVTTAMLTKNYEVFPANWLNSGFMKSLCALLFDVCVLGQKLFADMSTEANDQTATQVYFGHFPSGSSLKQLQHFGQIVHSNKFMRYDYGVEDNLARYG